ncbi:D-aminoacid aminotransferase-like PLP-dependent enzyme, partial [Auricularia subglabra TFB-10046 SS5]
YRVSVDTVATPASAFTRNKTTRRDHYNVARERAGIRSRGERREVILYNEDGEVTEGSVTNVSFWRDGRWVTPNTSSGGLPGTVRRWLLGQGRIMEGIVRRDDIRDGEYVMLTNSWHIVQLGRVEQPAQQQGL